MARKHRRDAAPGDVEFVPLTDAERQAHAEALRVRAEGEPDRRAQLLSEAAEYYAMLNQPHLADQLFCEALADGGAVAGSVHGYYADFLFDQHRDDEALEVIDQARRLRADDPDVFNVIGETLLAHDHPGHAARWFTTGLVCCLGRLTDIDLDDLQDPDVALLARGRHAARQMLGLAPDHIDELVARFGTGNAF